MGHQAIHASGLGKQFRLVQGTSSFPTLRDAVTASARRVGRALSPSRPVKAPGAPTDTFWALRDVSFDVAPGEVVGVVGGNGAGKSTLLKILSRITTPTEGRAEIRGRVGSLLEVGTGFHPELSGRENTFLNGAILGMTRREIARKFDEIVAFAEVDRFIDTPVKHYSSGMYLRLAFAVAAHLEPEILIVDEVLAVGDAAFQRKCLGKMGDVAHQGRTVLFVSHNLTAVEGLCTRAIWLSGGRIAGSGGARDVVSQYLRASATGLPVRHWNDLAEAPGNHLVRLRRAAVRPATGRPGDAIDVRSAFVMEFEYWNLDPGARLNLSLRVYNQQGVMVFNAGPLGDPAPCAAGLHRDVCHVPADLMNDGIYSIELLVVRDRQTVVYQHSGLLTFEVKDSAEGRGSWHGEWQGIVRPQLPWQSHEIEHAVAGTGHPAHEAQEAPGRVAIMDSSGRQSRMRVLVTGGAGFIGSHLVDALVSRGHQVRILDALVPQVHGTGAPWPAWVPADVETMRGDVRDPATWEAALRDCEVVYHLAAEVGVGQSMYEITRYMDANTMGTAHMLELLARGRVRPRKLILASSMSVYGEGAYRTASGDAVYPALRAAHTLQQRQWNLFAAHGDALVPQPTDEDKPLRPASIYAVSKRDQEEMCLTVGRAYAIPTVAFRCFNVYGPRQALSNPYTGIAAIFSGRILNGKPPVVFEDGRQGRDFINVTDIVQGLLLPLASDGADYQAVNLGTGRCTSVLEVAETLIRLLGADVTPIVNNHYRAGDIRCCYADISKAERLLGFRPAVTFEAGMEELIAWLRRQTAVDRVDAATAELKARGLTR